MLSTLAMNTLLYKSKEKQILEAVDLAGIFKMESQTKKSGSNVWCSLKLRELLLDNLDCYFGHHEGRDKGIRWASGKA